MGVAALHVDALARSADVPTKKPNLVFFLGEGLRYDEFSLMGSKILNTPNMDRIGREGFAFRNCFVINALCLPSRATILTGLYSHHGSSVERRRHRSEAIQDGVRFSSGSRL